MFQMNLDEKSPWIRLGFVLSLFLIAIQFVFGTNHLILFVFLLVGIYRLSEFYSSSVDKFRLWPNLFIWIKPVEKTFVQQRFQCPFVQKNPWTNLFLSKRIDQAIDEFCCLCLRDHIYPWLSEITHDDTLVFEAKQTFRYFLSTILRRVQNVDINKFVYERLRPLIFNVAVRYANEFSSSSNEPLKTIFENDLHVAMTNRQSELNYLKRLVLDLMPLISPKSLYECKGARHFLRETIVCQILLDGIDLICRPESLNRLFHLFFTNAIERRRNGEKPWKPPSKPFVEFLKDFTLRNGPMHKNRLALELTDVLYEKELLNQFSRVLDRYGSIGLLSIHVTLSDLLNDIPSASNILVRKKLFNRLKLIDERYLNPLNSDGFVQINDENELKDFLNDILSRCIENENETFDIQSAFHLLSRIHCQIYELVEEKYQRYFLSSDEHFLYICGRRMDSPDYRMIEEKFTEEKSAQRVTKRYTTTSYKELEEKDDEDFRNVDENSTSTNDERDLSTWKVQLTNLDETKTIFLLEVETMRNDEKNRWNVQRKLQDFYLLERKLTEFHGVFSDARLPPRRSLKNVEILKDFQHFLRHLLSKPTLRNSELLFNFLSQPDEFTLPNGEIILSKMFRVVPRRLRIEKGQYLDPFLISLINFAERAKPKSSQPAPVFVDILNEKLNKSIYGNNADLPTTSTLKTKNSNTTFESPYDQMSFIAEKIFSASPLVVYLLKLLRPPLKNTFDTFFEFFIDENLDDVLTDEENFLDVIFALRDAVFPHDAPNKEPMDLADYNDVVAAAQEYLPKWFKWILGEKNVQNGLEILLQYFQNPLLNKQLFYMILDEILVELFPELEIR